MIISPALRFRWFEDPNSPAPAPAPAPAPVPAPAPSPAPAAEPPAISPADLAALRAELANVQAKHKELADADEARKTAELTDAQKAEAAKVKAEEARDKALADLKLERAKLAIAKAAGPLNVDVELAEGLLLAKMEYDADGNPKGVDTALKALLVKHPNLVSGSSSSNPTNPARGGAPAGKFDPKNPPRLGTPGLFKS
ncbi:MAG TPA: hypothetical protein VGE07_01535 [Herpetosiphonaceae bacterium]